MRTKLLFALLGAAVLVAGIVLATGGDDGSDDSNAADATFVSQMISHHEGAIEMAEMAQQRAEHPEIRRLAEAIITAQRREIADMKEMHPEGTAPMHGGHTGMSEDEMGMDVDMDALERAKPFDRAFIDAMIPHHEGAVAMARKLLREGEHPGLRRMAQDVIAAQSEEIEKMTAWRNRWYGS